MDALKREDAGRRAEATAAVCAGAGLLRPLAGIVAEYLVPTIIGRLRYMFACRIEMPVTFGGRSAHPIELMLYIEHVRHIMSRGQSSDRWMCWVPGYAGYRVSMCSFEDMVLHIAAGTIDADLVRVVGRPMVGPAIWSRLLDQLRAIEGCSGY